MTQKKASDGALSLVAFSVRHLIVLVLSSIFLSGVGVAVTINTDFGNLDVQLVSIPSQSQQIAGLLYRPRYATAENPLPAVVLTHGISSAKETVSGIALELARRGFVALAIDEVGHGDSEGQIGGSDSDPTLGTLAAVRYLESKSFVDESFIGLVGHSLGAGAIRATAVAHGHIIACVFIGGGLGGMVASPAYGNLNSTFPKNLLVAVGKYDVLFEIDQLRKETLPPIFGTPQEIVPGNLYGNFSSQTARKLITPATTHLFEPLDPTIISETVNWLVSASKSGRLDQDSRSQTTQLYLYRDGAIFLCVVAFVGLVFPISSAFLDFFPRAPKKEKFKTKYGVLEDWKALVIWGLLGVVLYVPMVVVGLFVPVPPVVFGSSIAWWLLSVAVIGLLLILWLVPKFSSVRLNLKSAFSGLFDAQAVMIAAGTFLLLYLIANLVEILSVTDLRVIVPLFSGLRSTRRILVFVVFLPFFLVYFFTEGLYLHEFHEWSAQKFGFWSEVLAVSKVIGIKISPYVVFLGMQYVPMFFFGIRPLPSFVGFFAEFLWAIVPLFIISTACSWWFYRNTSTIGTGAIFNSFLFAWVAAALFPFGTFG